MSSPSLPPLTRIDEVTQGVYSVFSFADFYNAFQDLIGARIFRKRFVREFVAPTRGSRLLDIGCGTGSIIEYLPHEVEYVGFDANPQYIAHAQKKFGRRGHFFCRRVSEADSDVDMRFDFVLAIGLLHHLSDAEASSLFAIAHKCLKPGGYLLTCDNAFVAGQSRIARYIISKDRGQHVRQPEQYKSLAGSSFQTIKSAVRHDLLRIPYTHFIMKCQKPPQVQDVPMTDNGRRPL